MVKVGASGGENAATEARRGCWACEMRSGSMGRHGARSGASTARLGADKTRWCDCNRGSIRVYLENKAQETLTQFGIGWGLASSTKARTIRYEAMLSRMVNKRVHPPPLSGGG